MSELINKIYKNNAFIYKIVLFLIATSAIVYLFPKEGKFKYDFTQGKLWLYDNLYAPFDFAIQKSTEEIDSEKKEIEKNAKKHFVYNEKLPDQVKQEFNAKINALVTTGGITSKEVTNVKNIGIRVIDNIYKVGFVDEDSRLKIDDENVIISLRKGNFNNDVSFSKLLQSNEILPLIISAFVDLRKATTKDFATNTLAEVITPNVSFDADFTQKELEQALTGISYTKGKISKDELIIVKGDIVEGRKYNVLKSFEQASKSQTWTKSNYSWIVLGYSILVSFTLLMFLLFLYVYRLEVFNDNKKVSFIFFNMFFFILVQTLVEKYNIAYIYVVPLSVLPIILKAFFDARLAFSAHVLTVLLLGFIVHDSFEFIYLHIIAGIVTVLTVSRIYKRGSLFAGIGLITLTYMITYFAFSIIKEGNASDLKLHYFLLFAANGLLSFLSVFFIYIYEKLFGFVSDITLLELSNTNSPLLRELNEKAPGTFQHSMQVANLAEAAANEIDANSMLVRTGALYHDIGKMENPMYFTENQSTGVNPHDDLSPSDSARIILNHIFKGIEIAKKNNIPDRIIDFIRTHHGTSLVYYFYKKEQDENPEIAIDRKKFRYQGPIPFSKETAILMICDAAEAASKSLKNPTAQSIDDLIERMVDKQKNENQFINSNITFREIEKIKKIIKNKLMNIYHLRIEYPD